MAPPRRISRDTIVATSLAIVDEEGLEALVIRNIAKRLGVQPGALYNHFHDMDEIKAEVVWEATKVVGTIRPISGSWQEAARLHVTAFLDRLLRHPNVMPLLVGRAGQQIWVRRLYAGYGGHLETLLRLLATDGITGRRALTVIESLEAFTIGIATVAVAMNDETGVVGPPSGFEPNPRLERLMARANIKPQQRVELALDCLLVGLESLCRPPTNGKAPRRSVSAANPVSRGSRVPRRVP